MFRLQQNQPYWLSHERAVASQFDEAMNVKYGNFLEQHSLLRKVDTGELPQCESTCYLIREI